VVVAALWTLRGFNRPTDIDKQTRLIPHREGDTQSREKWAWLCITSNRTPPLGRCALWVGCHPRTHHRALCALHIRFLLLVYLMCIKTIASGSFKRRAPVGGGGPIRDKGIPVASVGFAKTRSHALRRQASASTADKPVNEPTGKASQLAILCPTSHFPK
jgi:hypothetical protein